MTLPPALLALALSAAPAQVTLDFAKPGIRVSPSLYGIFFEEINHAGDGGMYAEMLQNRGFERGTNGAAAPSWSAKSGQAALDAQAPFNAARPRSLKFTGTVSNEGFWGVPLKRGESYRLVVWAKGKGPLIADLGTVSQEVGQLRDGWRRLETTITADETNPKARLDLTTKSGPAWLAYASLMPVKTWGKANLRPDLARLVDEMKPAFVRFPGGCFVEGQDFDRMWDWKASLGPVEQRPGKDWRFWGYSSTDGLGFHEYLQWTEDMGSEALFVANCGMTHGPVAPMAEMGRFVQDALDAIEYANGPVTSKWGALRAKNGRAKPFKLRYLQIGNENGGPLYDERYTLMAKAIKAKHPEMKLIACVWGGVPKSYPLEIIDEHYYATPSFFWANANRYDSYDRKGPKVYVGEYAVTRGCGEGNLVAALSEAAFMTGLERNSDIVTMASYAPLLANSNRKQWNPNAIVFDNHRSFGTPSYWVQRLFAQNRPDRIVPATHNVAPLPAKIAGNIGLQTWRTQAEFWDVKLSLNGRPAEVGRWQRRSGTWKIDPDRLTQTDMDQDRVAVAPDVKLDGATSISLSMKARKLSGNEGFIVMLGGSEGFSVQWNLGGWENTKHAFQVMAGGPHNDGVPGRIETGREYDIRVELEGTRLRGYLDGKLIQEMEIPKAADFAQVCGIDEKRNELVIKLVNGSEVERTVQLNAGRALPKSARETILTGPALLAENDFAQPNRIAPVTRTITLASDGTYRMPARSLSILRLRLPR